MRTLARPGKGLFIFNPMATITADRSVAHQLQEAWEILETLTDPEIPVVSLKELGILRDIKTSAEGLDVVITPTYSGCPAMHQIEDDILAALSARGISARVVTQLSPVWTTDWMTDAAKAKLRDYGIAPPHTTLHPKALPSAVNVPPQAKAIQFAPTRNASAIDNRSVACPHCGSLNTTETSHFGSTACKALFRCLACQEPFDYFKPF